MTHMTHTLRQPAHDLAPPLARTIALSMPEAPARAGMGPTASST